MVSALDSGSSGPGSSPGRGHCVVFMGKRLHSQCLSSPRGKWVLANLILGVTLRWTSIVVILLEIFLVASCYSTRKSSGLKGHLACMQTLPTFTFSPRKNI